MGELGRVATIPDAEMPYEVSSNHARVLARAGSYAWSRFLDALVRWYSILWLHEELGTRARDSSEGWKSFAALSIKDAHTDIGSLMDALALFLINIDKVQYPRLQGWAPGFTTLLKTDSEPRTKLSPPIQGLADEATDWYGFVSRIRNSLVHRQHVRLICGAPSKALAFQVYLKNADPAITAEPFLVRPAGGPVVDFSLYGIWLLAEASFFMDRIAAVAMQRFGIPTDSLGPGHRHQDAEPLPSELDRLIQRVTSTD